MEKLNGFDSYLEKTLHLSSDRAATIYRNLEKLDFKKGDLLLRAGDRSRNSFFVEKGLLRSYTLDGEGREHIIQFAPENWFMVDRGSVYFQDLSETFIEAIEPGQLVLIPAGFMSRAQANGDNLGHYNDLLLHNHIRHLQQRINLLLGASAQERYLHFIHTYPNLLARVPQWMVASYLGITPESLSRVRAGLSQKDHNTQDLL